MASASSESDFKRRFFSKGSGVVFVFSVVRSLLSEKFQILHFRFLRILILGHNTHAVVFFEVESIGIVLHDLRLF